MCTPHDGALQIFVGLASCTDCTPWYTPEQYAAMRARSVCSLYRTQNAVRHGLPRHATARAFRGYAFEAIRGAPQLAEISRLPWLIMNQMKHGARAAPGNGLA